MKSSSASIKVSQAREDALCLHCHEKILSALQGPLGAGALAGNCFGLDREAMAQALGFDGLVSIIHSINPLLMTNGETDIYAPVVELYGSCFESRFRTRGLAIRIDSHDSY